MYGGEEYSTYDVLARKTKINHMSSSEHNRVILRKLKKNDPDFDTMWLDTFVKFGDGEDTGWLGYFLGKSKCMHKLCFHTNIIKNRSFYVGLSHNKSIQKIRIHHVDILNGEVFRMLNSFFKNNHNLIDIEVSGCIFQEEDARQLLLALGCCNNRSLKRIRIYGNYIRGGQLVNVISALNRQPQLEELDLELLSMGRNACTALTNLLQNTIKHLQTLNLSGNNIDDKGVEDLIQALANGGSSKSLKLLDLSDNQTITIEGWKTVSTLLERADFSLEKLNISENNIGNKGALIFANALRDNCKLKALRLHGNHITAEGWAYISTLLCDPSTVNRTYLSNHTLVDLGNTHYLPFHTQFGPDLNASNEDKGLIAMVKILQSHSNFNVQPFFEWEFKVLPLIINWLEKADDRAAAIAHVQDDIKRMKLACMYEFVREFPALYVQCYNKAQVTKSAMLMRLLKLGFRYIRP